ncbi:MAG: transcription repressor NadR, partial [Coriobacteriaceae bacterium]|nr:transcription repressor NadR [Coriobacteriaceae bacterium]
MTGVERRNEIALALEQAEAPLSGGALAKLTGVSRQVVVQDIALLRTQGLPIVATARGYVLEKPAGCRRLFKCRHTEAETEDELVAIVDAGGTVEDVIVNHRVYGRMSAQLGIASRRDVERFMEGIRSGKSSPLLTVTSGYHFHHVSAPDDSTLDDIERILSERGYLSEFMPYEV